MELFKSGKRPCEIIATLGYNKFLVYRTIKRFKETNNIIDRERSGRPRTVDNNQVRNEIKKKITRNPRQSLRKLAKNLNYSRESVRRVVKKKLKLKPYKLQRAHNLTDQMKKTRLRKCKLLLARLKRGSHRNIVFSDEKLFTINQAHNHHNDRIWCKNKISANLIGRKVMKKTNPDSVMVWAAITSTGKSPLLFIEKGIKINQETYENNILQNILLPWSQKHFKKKHWTFQQDSAPAHKANKTQQWCHNNLPDFISKGDWPSYSPDLNPLDFSVWSILESRACTKSLKNTKQLKSSLIKAWNSIDDTILRKIVDEFPKHLSQCIKQNGGHFENC